MIFQTVSKPSRAVTISSRLPAGRHILNSRSVVITIQFLQNRPSPDYYFSKAMRGYIAGAE